MVEIIKRDREFEKTLSEMSMEQLLELEEIIMRVMKRKLKSRKIDNWRNDFLKISTWSHLKGDKEVKVDKWEIEKF